MTMTAMMQTKAKASPLGGLPMTNELLETVRDLLTIRKLILEADLTTDEKKKLDRLTMVWLDEALAK